MARSHGTKPETFCGLMTFKLNYLCKVGEIQIQPNILVKWSLESIMRKIHLHFWLKTHAYGKSTKDWFKKLWPKPE